MNGVVVRGGLEAVRMTSTIIYGSLWTFLTVMSISGSVLSVVAALDREHRKTAMLLAALFIVMATGATLMTSRCIADLILEVWG